MNKAIIPALVASLLMFVLMGLGGNSQEPAPAASTQAVSAPAAPALAVVRLQDIYEQSRVGQEAVKHLEETQNAAIAKMTEIQGSLEAAKTDGDEATEQRLQVELQGLVYTFQEKLNGEQQRMVELVSAKVNEGIEKYRADNGLALIVSDEYAQAWDPQMDITDKVVAVIDQLPFELGELPSFDVPTPSIELPMGPESLAPSAAEGAETAGE